MQIIPELLPQRGTRSDHDVLNSQVRASEMNPRTNASRLSLAKIRAARPQRILYVDHTAKLGGGEIALLSLVTHVSRADFEPVVVLSEDGPLREKLCAAGIETHVLPLSPRVRETRKDALGLRSLLRLSDAGQILRYAAYLARFIRAERIVLVHTNSLKSDLFGGLAARLARVPLVWHVRDRIDANYLPRPVVWSFRRLCRWVPDYVIANSQSTLETLALPALLRFGAGSSRCEAIYSGITARPPLPEAQLPEIPAGLRWSPAPIRSTGATKIGLIGRISPWKGQHIFLQAAADVRRVFPEVRFQIIGATLFGEEAYEEELRDLVRELSLEDCVEFLGFREDVPRLVADLDIVVHASTSPEPFGQVIVEGMMAGKPVVATDAGGPREIIVAGETGLLVPAGDSAAMAEAIVSLLHSPETAREMGRRGYARACALFSIEKTVEKVEAVYHHLLAAAGRS